MYSQYFDSCDIKESYKREYISLFDGWLGPQNYHKLDEVTETDWSKFNDLIRMIAIDHVVYSASIEEESCVLVEDIDAIISDYRVSMEKESIEFTRLIIPDLECILTEDWDYTYILWHKGNGAVEKLEPLIKKIGLYQFNEQA